LKLQIGRPKYSCSQRLFQTAVGSYTVRLTQYDRLSQQQLRFLFCHKRPSENWANGVCRWWRHRWVTSRCGRRRSSWRSRPRDRHCVVTWSITAAMTGPSGRDVRLAFEAATMDLRGFVQLTRQVSHARTWLFRKVITRGTGPSVHI